MIGRRALIAAGLSLPLAAVKSPWAQSPWKGYYATGTRQRAVRFAGSDGATLAGTLLLPLGASCRKSRASCWWQAAARPTATATIRWRPNASTS